tara:strand:- start:134 stop:1516 length:1383 start_codon:yes stop_codon:yes gene_type:complete
MTTSGIGSPVGYRDAFPMNSGNDFLYPGYQGAEPDTRSHLEIELGNMIDPNAKTVNFPEWTTAEDRIKEYTDVFGDVRYDVVGIPDSTGSFPNMESAQRHLMNNYWDPNEIDLPRVIQELKDTRATNTGGIPKYLQGKNPYKYGRPYDEDFDPMDSSTWRIPAPEKDHLGNLQETIKYQTPDDSDFWQRTGEGHYQRNNLLDYYAQQGNPELQRGSSTGFFPTKSYPEFAANQLQDMVDNNQLVKKYKDSESAGNYDPNTKEIGVEEGTLGINGYTYGSPGNRYRKGYGYLNEVLSHETGHKDTDRDDIHNRITQKVPYPFNSYYHDYDKLDDYGRPERTINPYASTKERQAAVLHPTFHYLDNQFYPSPAGRQTVDINRKGLENVNALYNANKTSGHVIAKDHAFTGSPQDKFGGQSEARQWAEDTRQYSINDFGPSRQQSRQHYNTGGLASLIPGGRR